MDEAANHTGYGEKFVLLSELFPHPDRADDPDPDRRRWKDAELSRATGGGGSRTYLGALRAGRVKNPGARHLYLISEVMGFPVELWLIEPSRWPGVLSGDSNAPSPGQRVADMIGIYADVMGDEELVKLFGGALGATEVEEIRANATVTVAQLLEASRALEFDVRNLFFARHPETADDDLDLRRSVMAHIAGPSLDAGQIRLLDVVVRRMGQTGRGTRWFAARAAVGGGEGGKA